MLPISFEQEGVIKFTIIEDGEDDHEEFSYTMDQNRVEYIEDHFTYVLFRGSIADMMNTKNIELKPIKHNKVELYPNIRPSSGDLPQLPLMFLELTPLY